MSSGTSDHTCEGQGHTGSAPGDVCCYDKCWLEHNQNVDTQLYKLQRDTKDDHYIIIYVNKITKLLAC